MAIDFQWQGMAGIATSHIVGEIMANAVAGSLKEFDAFAQVKHIRIPLSDRFGHMLLAAGMAYYQMLEKLRV